MIGWNARMDGFQGAILSVKLKSLAAWNDARRKDAEIYNELLANLDEVIPPWAASYSKHVYHIYAVRVKRRDRLTQVLAFITQFRYISRRYTII
jgi:dTDP-4-amino-4,6-dideoxygalactose transaminase